MERRTHEGHMDWEYHNQGPVDPTSPFTHAAQAAHLRNGFGSPTKSSLFGRTDLSTPSNPFRQGQQDSLFSSPNVGRSTAKPFMNPSFTTPRKPFDETCFGTDDSPAPTEPSDVPDDSPEPDRFNDAHLSSAVSQSRINKNSRYKSRTPARKQIPGKGGIVTNRVPQRGFQRGRHTERGMNLYAHFTDHDMSDHDSDADMHPDRFHHASPHDVTKAEYPSGLVGSFLHTMDAHPNLPDILHKWIWFAVCCFTGMTVCYIAWSVLRTVQADILTANQAAKANTLGKMAACSKQYTDNSCSTAKAPKLLELCQEWSECMTQSTDVVYSRVFLLEVSHIANEVFGVWSMKTTAAVSCTFLFLVFGYWAISHTPKGRNESSRRASSSKRPAPETPRAPRYVLPDDAFDSDMSPPVFTQKQLQSGRRSPTKWDRTYSPVKSSHDVDMTTYAA